MLGIGVLRWHQSAQKLPRTVFKTRILKHGFGGECNLTFVEARCLLLFRLEEHFKFDFLLDISKIVLVKILKQPIT